MLIRNIFLQRSKLAEDIELGELEYQDIQDTALKEQIYIHVTR